MPPHDRRQDRERDHCLRRRRTANNGRPLPTAKPGNRMIMGSRYPRLAKIGRVVQNGLQQLGPKKPVDREAGNHGAINASKTLPGRPCNENPIRADGARNPHIARNPDTTTSGLKKNSYARVCGQSQLTSRLPSSDISMVDAGKGLRGGSRENSSRGCHCSTRALAAKGSS